MRPARPATRTDRPVDRADLRARLAAGVPDATYDWVWDDRAATRRFEAAADDVPTPAAVLVGLVPGDAPGVLLTLRHAALRRHGGQVAFPGGRIDPDDRDPEAAALREAQEEIGLDPARVELVGRLRDYVTATGYRITPVLGIVEPGGAYAAAPDEVDAIFQLPLATLLDAAAPVRGGINHKGHWREFWVWPHPEHRIWGVTANILVDLADRLRAGHATAPAG